MQVITYNCPISNNTIEYKYVSCEPTTLYLNIVKIDYKFSKLFFELLRKSIDELKEKKFNKVVQIVSLADFELFKTYHSVTLKKSNELFAIIECDIDNILDCFNHVFISK